MHFILFDLEFNQDFPTLQNFDNNRAQYPFEIIQIGAVKINAEYKTVDTFNRYIRPTFYSGINPFITGLTGITSEHLQNQAAFPEVFAAFSKFIAGVDAILCTWGMSDITELFKNAEYHQLCNASLPRMVINLQPYVSLHFKYPRNNLLRLQHAVELLNIPTTLRFHDAFGDALYTAEIFKKVYNLSIKPIHYDPSTKASPPKPKKMVIDIEKLIGQFEKMYAREMSKEEQEMIILAYKMGRTHQFLIEPLSE